MPKRRLLGCSFPIAIILIVFAVALFIIGLIAGPLGKSLLSGVHLPSWLSVAQPHPELPAETVFHLFGFPVTNSIIATWITMLVLVILSVAVSRRMKLIPGKLQVALESLIGWLYDFCVSAAGEVNGRRFFPLVATIFLFVGFNAWLGLIPGYGSFPFITEPELHGTAASPGTAAGHVLVVTDISVPVELDENVILVVPRTGPALASAIEEAGAVITDEEDEYAAELAREAGIPCVTGTEEATTELVNGATISVDGSEGTVSKVGHLIKPANTDFNTPLAVALISVLMTFVFGFRLVGKGFARNFFNFGSLFRAGGQLVRGKFGAGIITLVTGVVEAFVGLLELLSYFIRIVSFTFRLFGNMTAGEILLLVATFIIPMLFALPFYGLELLIGFIQALIFSGLTLIFLTLAATHHDEAE